MTVAFGAIVQPHGVRFRVWAPVHERVEVVIAPGTSTEKALPLEPDGGGVFSATIGGVGPGDLYAFRLNGAGALPDPASRFQPVGVHGPSEVIDPVGFAWTDEGWTGAGLDRAAIYELHVGTFTEAGTFASAADRLPYLADLGVTLVELMPVADFPGDRNWGYDGVSLFAPSRAYGRPDDLRRFVDRAHQLGLGVLLDVVYNHFGPDGAYALHFAPAFRSDRHHSPWGAAVNLDGRESSLVREFFIDNALHWLREYHVDGLRLDATDQLVDDSPRHFLAELAERARAEVAPRRVLLVAEDDRNLATIVRPPDGGGWGLDAVWADDFHHEVRRLAAGDRDGYFADYAGTTSELAETIEQGWLYQGQPSVFRGKPRGTSTAQVPRARMIVCLQNHDQIGNRAFGDRLNQRISPARFRALSALLFVVPETPLLFMGQEWAATSPFLYFTDHHAELGTLVTRGRREEFARFETFRDPARRDRIPDPQAVSTFEASRLRWDERSGPPHAGVLELYRTLLRLRREEPALQPDTGCSAAAPDERTLTVVREHDSSVMALVLHLGDAEAVETVIAPPFPHTRWTRILNTNEARFVGPHAAEDAPDASAILLRAV